MPPSAVTKPSSSPASASTAAAAKTDPAREPADGKAEGARPAGDTPAPGGQDGQKTAAEQPLSDESAGRPQQADDDVQVSVVPGITRYHRSDCQLIRFLSADDLDVMTRRAATEGGCVPCKACKPDQAGVGAKAG